MCDGFEDDALWATFSSTEKRLAFHAKLWMVRTRRFSVPVALMQRWRAALPEAIENQNLDIDAGGVSKRFTIAYVLGSTAPCDVNIVESGIVASGPYVIQESVVR